MRIRQILFIILVLATAVLAQFRVKDVADVQGVAVTQLVGYGLVVGLAGTGDGAGSAATLQSTVNLLRNMGLEVDPRQLRLRNVASVLVTANMPAFAKPGGRLDIQVSSLGDARSLSGGVLLMTPLKAVDGEIYAMAQGAIGTGGGYSQSSGGASLQQGQNATGVISSGAVVQRENLANRMDDGPLRFVLHEPDFSSAQKLSEAFNQELGANSAIADDAATVRILTKDPPQGRASLIARLEGLRVAVDRPARIVINERTGTIVVGSDVKISEVAVTHGALTIRVEANRQVAQPNALAGGTTETITNPNIQAQERNQQMQVLGANTNVGDLARSLNSLGASPRDLIAILQAIQKSGAMQAELVIM